MKIFKKKAKWKRLKTKLITRGQKIQRENDKQIQRDIKKILGETDNKCIKSIEEKYRDIMRIERENNNNIVHEIQISARDDANKLKKEYEDKLSNLRIKESQLDQRLKKVKDKEHKLFEISKELARQITKNESLISSIERSAAGFEENKRLNKNLTKQISNEMED